MSDELPTQPPDPETTAADVLRFVGSFKKELFRFLDEKEAWHAQDLTQRDANVLAHFAEMRDEMRKISAALPQLIADVQRLDREVDGHDWWRSEFRDRTHGIRNAFMAVINAIGELMVRLDKVDGLGTDIAPLMDEISRMLAFKRDTDLTPPPANGSEIPRPPLVPKIDG